MLASSLFSILRETVNRRSRYSRRTFALLSWQLQPNNNRTPARVLANLQISKGSSTTLRRLRRHRTAFQEAHSRNHSRSPQGDAAPCSCSVQQSFWAQVVGQSFHGFLTRRSICELGFLRLVDHVFVNFCCAHWSRRSRLPRRKTSE